MGKHHTRKVNPALKAWVAFVKKVQKEEKCSYPEAMKKAKIRKDKGAKWRGGCGNSSSSLTPAKISGGSDIEENNSKTTNQDNDNDNANANDNDNDKNKNIGGWRATKKRRSRGGKKSKRRRH